MDEEGKGEREGAGKEGKEEVCPPRAGHDAPGVEDDDEHSDFEEHINIRIHDERDYGAHNDEGGSSDEGGVTIEDENQEPAPPPPQQTVHGDQHCYFDGEAVPEASPQEMDKYPKAKRYAPAHEEQKRRDSKVCNASLAKNRLLWWLKQKHDLTDATVDDLLSILRNNAFKQDDIATSPYVLEQIGRGLFPPLEERQAEVTETKLGLK